MLNVLNEEDASENNLALTIQSRNEARASQSDKFFDSLIDKYAKKAKRSDEGGAKRRRRGKVSNARGDREKPGKYEENKKKRVE